MLISRETINLKKEKEKEEIVEVKNETVSSLSSDVTTEIIPPEVFSFDVELLNALCILSVGTTDFELLANSTDLVTNRVKQLELKKKIQELQIELGELEKLEM